MKQRAGSKVTEAEFQDLEKLVSQEPTPDRAAAKLAKLLKVQRTEVALLRVDRGLLSFYIQRSCELPGRFLFPVMRSRLEPSRRALPFSPIPLFVSST